MEILEVTPEFFDAAFPNPNQIFGSGAFSKLNESRFEKVYYLVFKDTKTRLGIILGLREGMLLSPFSATFGGFEFVSEDVKLYQIDAAIQALFHWATAKKYTGIRIIPPPFFYREDFLAKVTNCMYRAGFETKNMELNYHFLTEKISETYENEIWYNARKNLKRSNSYGLTFEKLETKNGKQAYDVIAQNRAERGFPLRLTWEQLMNTNTVIPMDFFLARNTDESIGAAIVYHIAPSIVRVIYWGDLPKFSEYKTMNFLSFNLFKHYKQQGIKILDIGHSTVDSVPNNGLCEFKESIGCSISLLYEFYKKLD